MSSNNQSVESAASAPRGALAGAGPGRLFWAAVCLHVVLHLVAAMVRQHIEHDEAITYLAASAHEDAYANITDTPSPPYGEWAPAARWRSFMEPGAPFVWSRIAQDLGHHDIHPPLYFWLVHVGLVGLGVSPWLGPLINLGLDLLTLLVVYGLARRVLGDARWAGVAALLWAVSPGPLQASLDARQYSLLGLAAALLVYQTVAASNREAPFGPRAAAALCASTWLGLMTQYQFAILAAAAAAVLTWRLWRHARGRLGVALGAMAAGAALMFPMHDLVLTSLARQQTQLPAFSWGAWFLRVAAVIASPGTLFVVSTPLQIVVVVAALVCAARLWRPSGGRVARLRGAASALEAPVQDILVFAALAMAVLWALFLAHHTPSSSMQSKYLTWAHPLAACLLVRGLRALPAARQRGAVLGVGLLLFGNALALGGWAIYQSVEARAARAALAGVDRVVIDNPWRGMALPVVFQLPGELPVFVMRQQHLQDRPDLWLDTLTTRSLVVTSQKLGGSLEGRERIERLLGTRFRPVAGKSVLWPRHTYYRLLPVDAREAP